MRGLSLGTSRFTAKVLKGTNPLLDGKVFLFAKIAHLHLPGSVAQNLMVQGTQALWVPTCPNCSSLQNRIKEACVPLPCLCSHPVGHHGMLSNNLVMLR